MDPKLPKQKGFVIHPMLVLFVAICIVGYFLISSTFPFKDKITSLLFPKDSSYANTAK